MFRQSTAFCFYLYGGLNGDAKQLLSRLLLHRRPVSMISEFFRLDASRFHQLSSLLIYETTSDVLRVHIFPTRRFTTLAHVYSPPTLSNMLFEVVGRIFLLLSHMTFVMHASSKFGCKFDHFSHRRSRHMFPPSVVTYLGARAVLPTAVGRYAKFKDDCIVAFTELAGAGGVQHHSIIGLQVVT